MSTSPTDGDFPGCDAEGAVLLAVFAASLAAMISLIVGIGKVCWDGLPSLRLSRLDVPLADVRDLFVLCPKN